MFRLDFTTKVLGEIAAERLRCHEVVQTLRSPQSGIVRALLNSTLRVGDQMEVALDGEVIGMACPAIIDRTDWESLTLMDATRGGFSNKPELAAALHKAGYRFSPMPTYLFYRIQFTWFRNDK